MKIETRDMVSVSDVNAKGVSWLIAEASSGRTLAVMKNNKVAAVVAGTDVMEQLESLETLQEDLRLWTLALARMATDTGRRYDLYEVAEEFGIDLSEDEAEED